MENKLKAYLSIASIIVFGLAAMASFGPDPSTNTSVAISDCMSMPPISGNVSITISYKDKNGIPIPEAPGIVYIWRQEVTTDGSCKVTALGLTPLHEDIYTDANGNFVINGYPWTFDEKEELHRVEVIIEKTALYTGCRSVQVRKYGSGATFVFNCVGLRFTDL